MRWYRETGLEDVHVLYPGDTSTHQHSVPVLLNVRVIFFHGLSPREEGPPILYYSPYIITIYSASRYAEIPLEYLPVQKDFDARAGVYDTPDKSVVLFPPVSQRGGLKVSH